MMDTPENDGRPGLGSLARTAETVSRFFVPSSILSSNQLFAVVPGQTPQTVPE